MPSPALVRTSRLTALVFAAVLAPQAAHAQPGSGKWIATISLLSTVSGSADLTVDPRNEKQSKAKLTFRNVKRETRLAWDIVEGRCRDEGTPIAAQAAFAQIQTAMDGSGTATANLPKLESGKLYYLRVFDFQRAPTDASAYGCANISEKP